MTKQLKALLFAIIILGIILFTALALATRNNASFAYNYSILLYLNIAVILIMTALLLFLAYWLMQRLRNNVFGTRLLTRFALSFVILAVVPSILLVVISNLFVSRTINSWFNLKLDNALTAGIDFGRDRLLLNRDITQEQLTKVGNQDNLQDPDPISTQATLQKNQWQTLIGLNAQGHIIWRIDNPSQNKSGIDTQIPIFKPEVLKDITHDWVQIEDETDQTDTSKLAANSIPMQYIHAIHRIDHTLSKAAAIKPDSRTQFIYTQKAMPQEFSMRVSDIQNGLRDYQATETSRASLSALYQVTLIIILMITLMAALAAAFLIANRMIQPILWLAQATRQVAAGQYALVPQPVQGSDEMIQLVDSFGDMAQQLEHTQTSLQLNQKQLESAKAYSEAVLDNLSSGVLVLDETMTLRSHNQTAQRLFQTQLNTYQHQQLHQIEALEPLLLTIENQITQAQEANRSTWRIQHNYINPINPHPEELTLSIQGSRFFSDAQNPRWILVCDDVTPIISAQRTLAWGEVARRLAHEIKNPLTPIQLSAERLSYKLNSKLDNEGQIQLERGTRTIINQVAALQTMVNEFRDYARTPQAVFASVNLNQLIEEICVLYENGPNHPTQPYQVQSHLSPNLPMLWADGQQLRQVLHNLIKNAIEAYPSERLAHPIIELRTELEQTHTHNLVPTNAVKLTIRDNGAGFSEAILARMFEPYNSNKAHGTGLGLPIVKKIIDGHHAHINIKNIVDKNQQNVIMGAQINILFLNVINEELSTNSKHLL